MSDFSINIYISSASSFQHEEPYLKIPSALRIKMRLERLFSLAAGKTKESAEREKRFALILKEYESVISGICFSYSNNQADLKDLRQDILINIWKGLPTFRGESGLKTWVYRVALNTCVSTVRKKSKNPATVPIQSVADPADESDTTFSERVERLHSLISGLSPLDKAVITMWLDECKYEEIAEVTGISRNNVAVKINRIKQKLADGFIAD